MTRNLLGEGSLAKCDQYLHMLKTRRQTGLLRYAFVGDMLRGFAPSLLFNFQELLSRHR